MLQTGSADQVSAPTLDDSPLRARAADIASRTVEYSRFVRIAKILLPSTAAGLFLLIVLYSSLHKPITDIQISLADLKKWGGQLEMTNPSLTYTDDENRAFFVNADRAVQTGEKDLWHLDSVRGRMTPPAGRGYNLSSDTGLVDAAKKILDLKGRVLVVSDEGYTFEARSAHVDMDQSHVTSEEPIKARGGASRITADRFEMWDKGAKLHFEGNVHFTSESTTRLVPPQPEDRASTPAESQPANEGTRGP